MDTTKLTPAQKQYMEIKQNYQDSILFFRLGDFYEVFYEDAKICSKELDIALTARNKNSENPIPMAGVPYHSAEKYISKLIKSGYKVVIAEQNGDVTPGKLVNREVSSVLTPGTYLDDYESYTYNYIGALTTIQGQQINYNFCRGDFSIGDYFTLSFENLQELYDFIIKKNFVEIVLDIDLNELNSIKNHLSQNLGLFTSVHFKSYDSQLFLKSIFDVDSISSFGNSLDKGKDQCAALLFSYLKDTQKSDLKNINSLNSYGTQNAVLLDDVTIKNLEIFQSSYEGSKKYSLIGVLDNTNSAPGSRLLKEIIVNPTQDLDILNTRLDNIDYYSKNQNLRLGIIKIMKNIGDLSKTSSLLIYKKNSPFTWQKLLNIFTNIFQSENNILYNELIRIGQKESDLILIQSFYDTLLKGLKQENFQEDMNYIQDGFDENVDKLRKVAYHSDELLLDYQKYIVQTTGLNNLRIKFITNQGFFIEVSKKDSEILEGKMIRTDEKLDFMRRQTLKTAERYSTSYLDNIEKQIIISKAQLQKEEKQILVGFVSHLEQLMKKISLLSTNLAWIDLYSSYAQLSIDNGYIKPILSSNYEIQIESASHPVIEKHLPKPQKFISNSINLSQSSHFHVITGPNMGGKSTFLRQNALLVLMAHCGLWIPAKSAKIGLIDGIFARVGSGDNIAKNQSTFMTEMIEMSNILHNSTSRSFIVLDELGRGTSTYDGMALAREIVIYIANKIKAKTLFATHYHELISLEGHVEGVENFSVDVYETDKDVVFLKKIIKGGANKSYGIDVAKLAGLPNEIIQKARKYLKRIEDNSNIKQPMMESLFPVNKNISYNANKELDDKYQLINEKYNTLSDTISSIDIDNLTPIQALQLLIDLKKQI